jgi:hypothetical protein
VLFRLAQLRRKFSNSPQNVKRKRKFDNKPENLKLSLKLERGKQIAIAIQSR